MQHIIEIENLSKDYEIGFWKKKRPRCRGRNVQAKFGAIFLQASTNP